MVSEASLGEGGWTRQGCWSSGGRRTILSGLLVPQGLLGERQDVPFAGMVEKPAGHIQREPAHVRDLVVVILDRATTKLDEVEVDRLVHLLPLAVVGAAPIAVLDRTQRPADLAGEAGLLAHLAEGGLLERLFRFHAPLRQAPHRPARRLGERDLDAAVRSTIDDTTG